MPLMLLQTGETMGTNKLIHPPAWCDPARYLRRSRIERQVTADFRRQYCHNLWCGTQYLGYLCHIERCRSLWLQVKFGYDGHTRIIFTPKEQPE